MSSLVGTVLIEAKQTTRKKEKSDTLDLGTGMLEKLHRCDLSSAREAT